jgi:hypothetical protein
MPHQAAKVAEGAEGRRTDSETKTRLRARVSGDSSAASVSRSPTPRAAQASGGYF